jgi:hypothetical protein
MVLLLLAEMRGASQATVTASWQHQVEFVKRFIPIPIVKTSFLAIPIESPGLTAVRAIRIISIFLV